VSQIVATPPLAGVQICVASVGQIKILSGVGDPNSSSTDSSASDLANAAIGSLYLRQDGPDSTHCLYVKTAIATPAALTGTWTGK
jgi:hypothetical protein